MISLPWYTFVILGAVLLIGGTAAVTFYVRWQRAESDLLDQELDQDRDVEDVDAGDLIDLPPPQVKTGGLFGEVGNRVGLWWHYKKRKRLLGKGYFQWYLIEDGWPRPKFVKPVADGGGIPKLEHDGVTYLFPASASRPDMETGLRTIAHKKYESDPLDLEVPNELAIRADEMSEYLAKELTSEAPQDKFWEFGLDMTGEQMMWLMILLIVGGSVVYNFLTGGLA